MNNRNQNLKNQQPDGVAVLLPKEKGGFQSVVLINGQKMALGAFYFRITLNNNFRISTHNAP